MKIAFLADLHGHLPKIDPCDLVIIPGDLCPATNHQVWFQDDWMQSRFLPWAHMLDCDKVFYCWGNHDFVGEGCSDALYSSYKVNCFTNKGIEYKGLNFWFSPHTPIFYNWAFNADPEKLKAIFSGIPEGLDFLVTHGPAYQRADMTVRREAVGSKELLEAVEEKKPGFHLSGHIHSARPYDKVWDTTRFINCSVTDEQYRLAHLPVYLEVEALRNRLTRKIIEKPKLLDDLRASFESDNIID